MDIFLFWAHHIFHIHELLLLSTIFASFDDNNAKSQILEVSRLWQSSFYKLNWSASNKNCYSIDSITCDFFDISQANCQALLLLFN